MSKYRSVKTLVDGIVFASKKEAMRYLELKFLARAGEITDLELQPAFPIKIAGQKICVYKADFSYQQCGERVVEDVKGVKTPVYRLKKKLVEAYYNIKILET